MDLKRASTPASTDRPSLTTSLNDRLDTNYVDLGGADSNSYGARYTKTVTGLVGNFVTPRQLLVVLRILKALTFVFLIFRLFFLNFIFFLVALFFDLGFFLIARKLMM